MAVIKAPNKKYTGVSATVRFVMGEGRTDEPQLIAWFKTHGYEVIEDEPPMSDLTGEKTMDVLREMAAELGIEFTEKTQQKTLMKKIEEAQAAAAE